jgi:hypothetical protein
MVKRLCINGCCLLLFALVSCARPPTTRPSPLAPTPAQEADALAARKALWQKKLDEGTFVFHDAVTSAADSLARYKGSPKIKMEWNDAPLFRWATFEVVPDRRPKAIIRIHGHAGSVFRVENEVLYFAHFPEHSTGCTVTAHDLSTGKELWKTNLNALSGVKHSLYFNSVTMEVSKPEGAGVIIIYGEESQGNYFEVLDQKTGQVLAHRSSQASASAGRRGREKGRGAHCLRPQRRRSRG